MTRGKRLRLGLGVVVLASGSLLLSEQVWLGAKASVAGALIDRAFRAHLIDGRAHRPWNWADTHPIARLEIPRLGVRRVVLHGASGASMAFGPGHIDGTASPNRPGNCALAGHRDSWFAFLGELREGDEIRLRDPSGTVRYIVTTMQITSRWDTEVLEPTAESRLTLITCYPFDGLTRGDERYVVVALPH